VPLPRTRGLVCIVTERHRLAPGQSAAVQRRALIAQAQAAADAGADLFQIRENDLTDIALLDLAEAVKGALGDAPIKVLVNDRLDVGLASRVDGLHLKESGIPVAEARSMAPAGWLIGVSGHSANQVAAAGQDAADYVVFGTVFPTPSKPAEHPWAGMEGLTRAVRATRVPVLAIGGIDEARVWDVARVAAGIAAIGWFATTDSHRLGAAVREARRAFDSTEPLHLH
jgi:thiamine-phosphate pyrophosphorylase